MPAKLDHFDSEILRVLHNDGRLTINDLSARIGLSPSPTARRLRHLEEIGVITGYAALINEATLGFGFTVFVSVQLDKQVDEALARHQLKLYYQPKMAAGEHRLVGAEGLVRWEHPDGLLTPAQFLPHLEADKMMAMTQHLVRQCVRDLAGNPWLPPLSLNLDADIADEASLLELIMDELTVWHVDPARLMIEIAEAGLVRRLDRLLEGLAGLRGRGVRISMDDFGTGGAALARFPRLLVDEVKIDRCFVLGIEHHAAHRYLAGMMTELAHYFGMSVVAEGVETEAAADSLREAGCDTLQGFLFSPPLPLDEFSRWVARQPEPGDCA